MGHRVAVAHDPSARCAGTSTARVPRGGGKRLAKFPLRDLRQISSGLNSGWTSGLRHLKRSSERPVLTT
jgi:hypothetical protein